jgi:hypothetical protein
VNGYLHAPAAVTGKGGSVTNRTGDLGGPLVMANRKTGYEARLHSMLTIALSTEYHGSVTCLDVLHALL